MQCNNSTNCLQIMHWNCQGITTISHSVELHIFMKELSIDILLLNETFLKPNHKFVLPGYDVYRKDRITHGGGVALAIRSNLKHQLENSIPTKAIENICASVEIGNKKVMFISAYCPSYTADFKTDLDLLTSTRGDFFLLGDLNAQHTSWNCAVSDRAGKALFDHQNQSSYYIYYPYTPTRFPQNIAYRRPSTIDLLLSNSTLPFTDIETHSCKLYSDHLPITFSINSRCNESEKLFPDYRKTNWTRFNRVFESKLNSSILFNNQMSFQNIELSIREFTKLLLETCAEVIPNKKIKGKSLQITALCKQLIRNRNTHRRKFQRCSDPNLKAIYKAIIRELNKLIGLHINNSRNIQWSTFLYKLPIGSKQFWRITKRFKGKNKKKGSLIVNNREISNNLEKANILADYFAESHLTTLNSRSSMETKVDSVVSSVELDNDRNNDLSTFTNLEEIIFIISELKNSKAPGVDNISNTLLKKLPKRAYEVLVEIFNICIQNSYFPKEFKRAKVIPIPKAGKDPKAASSYRPISLLNSLDKVLEKIILKRLNNFVDSNNLLNNFQYGFRDQHSTVHQIRRVINMIRTNKEKRYSTGVLFLDIEKAFDSIWHNGLIYKLHGMQFPTYLIRLLKSFLTDRTFFVEVDGFRSSLKSIPAGVPQGSVLSPILYSLYTSDFKPPRGNDVAFYADDSAFISHGKVSNAIVKRMQKSLDSASKYFSKWKIKINESKSQAIMFPFNKSPKRIPNRSLMVNGDRILFSKTIKYLGINLDEKLTFKPHLEEASNKAIRCGRALFPLLNRKSKLNSKNKLLLYKMCIRPILTYGCQVWLKCAKTHKKRLQIIQNKNLKIIYNLPRRFSTVELHRKYKQKTIEIFIKDLTLSFNDRCRRSTYDHLRNLA